MKILLISGTHNRHLYFFHQLLGIDAEFSAIVMQRENQLPLVPPNLLARDQKLFAHHFEARFTVENARFGAPSPEETFAGIPQYFCEPHTLNTAEAAQFVATQQPDLAVVFGPDLLKPPLFDALPATTINLHLGLSPWYRGAATLFWPFYFLEPNFAGATFHELTANPDAGNLLHQSVPALSSGDGIHDVGAKTVEAATADFVAIAKRIVAGEKFPLVPQRGQGKLFSRFDFRASHLRMIYEIFNDDIVDGFLAGDLSAREPKLHRAL
jgi:methionyl-tRNA formyltransferase